MKILMALASRGQAGDTGPGAGARLEAFAAPYFAFADAGAAVTLASPEGGPPSPGPGGARPAARSDATRRLAADPAARDALAHTARLADLHAGEYDALFYPRVRGFRRDPALIALIEATRAAGRAAAGASRARVAFSHARAQDGTPLVSRPGTGGSGDGEAATRLAGVVPFLAADALRGGAVFQTAPDWRPFVLVDDVPPAGLRPASPEATARALLRVLAAAEGARRGHTA